MRSIEAARAIAAVSVALMHCGNLMRVDHFSGSVGLGGLFSFGYIGVDFFFVLSGFIISYVHYNDIGIPSTVPRYLWRRLTRVYPIFWFCLLLYIAASVAGQFVLGKPFSIDLGLGDILGTALLLPLSEPKYLGVAWSLQFEIIFYLAFCGLLVNRRFGIVLLSAWSAYVLGVMMGVLPATNPQHFSSTHCLQFAMGVGIGILTKSRDFPCVTLRTLMIVIAALVAAVAYETRPGLHAHADDGRIVLGLASAAILWTLVELEKQSAITTPNWLYRFGSISYSVYLSHILFINLTFSLLAKGGLYHRLPEIAVFSIGLGSALAAASIVGYFVELPLVSRLKDLVAK